MKSITSQRLTAARIALHPRERLILPRMKVGNSSDSKAGTGNDIVFFKNRADIIYTCTRGHFELRQDCYGCESVFPSITIDFRCKLVSVDG